MPSEADWIFYGPGPYDRALINNPLIYDLSDQIGRYVFYNNSVWDGRTAGADPPDDDSVAADKQPLLPGQKASFENYTSYVRFVRSNAPRLAGALPGDHRDAGPRRARWW